MDKSVFKSVISDNMDEMPQHIVNPRNIRFEGVGNYVFVGMRGVGKSYLLYQRMQELLAKGMKPHEMLYVNFDDERLSGMKSDDLNLLLETHLEMYGVKPVLFLDEIQNVSGWEKFARKLADTKHRVYIAGSNAKMLSGEIQTTLDGRYIVVDVYPYDFKEYLSVNKTGFSSSALSSASGRAAILKRFNDYFRFGGLPESLAFSSKRDYLNSIYQKIYLGDIAARHAISNLPALRILLKKLAKNVRKPVSYNRITNVVFSAGAKASINTIIHYIEYAKEAYLITPIHNIAGKIVGKEIKPKYYYTDNGILNLFLIDGAASLFENLVAINLLRKYGHDGSVFFYNKGVEVDFYVPETATAIQACYNLDNADGTTDREISALLKMSNNLECKKLMLITGDTEKTIIISRKKIEAVPLWKWLLGA